MESIESLAKSLIGWWSMFVTSIGSISREEQTHTKHQTHCKVFTLASYMSFHPSACSLEYLSLVHLQLQLWHPLPYQRSLARISKNSKHLRGLQSPMSSPCPLTTGSRHLVPHLQSLCLAVLLLVGSRSFTTTEEGLRPRLHRPECRSPSGKSS